MLVTSVFFIFKEDPLRWICGKYFFFVCFLQKSKEAAVCRLLPTCNFFFFVVKDNLSSGNLDFEFVHLTHMQCVCQC